MIYILAICLIVISLICFKIVYDQWNKNNMLIKKYSSDLYSNKLGWLKDSVSLNTSKKYLYAYNQVPEFELRTHHAILKSHNTTSSFLNLLDFFVKIIFPFILWILGILFLIPNYLAPFVLSPDKSNRKDILQVLSSLYIDLFNTVGMSFLFFILVLIFSIFVYIIFNRILKSDIELRINLIQMILDSKYKNNQEYLLNVTHNHVLKENWEFEYVIFLKIPVIIIQPDSSDTKLVTITAQNDESIFVGGDTFKKAKSIFKVK